MVWKCRGYLCLAPTRQGDLEWRVAKIAKGWLWMHRKRRHRIPVDP